MIVFNTLILLLIANLVLAVIYSIKDKSAPRKSGLTGQGPLTPSGHFYQSGPAVDNGKRTPSNLTVFDFNAYEGVMSEPEISRMLDEFYDEAQRGVEYQAWVQFSHRVVDGEFLTIGLDPNGTAIRDTPTNPPLPADGEKPIEIFVFGGSTTYGVGVPDQHTWPSYLSQILNEKAKATGLGVPVTVTNYGRLGYYPTQELHFIIDVLRSGQRPELVIFMDGVNLGSFDDTPDWTRVFQQRFEEAQHGTTGFWPRLPMSRAATSIRNRFMPKAEAPPKQNPGSPADIDISPLVERFKQARDSEAAICAQYEVEPLFFLQPDAPYNYPAHLHSIGERFVGPKSRAFRERFYAKMLKEDGFTNLTTLFEKWGERKAIIDGAHYSPNFCKFLAENVAEHIDLARLKERRAPNAPPTGTPRRLP